MSLYLSGINLSIPLFIFMTPWPCEMIFLRVFIMGIITDALQYSLLIFVWLLQIPLIILPLSQLKPLLRTKLCERLALRIGCCYISFAPGASLTYNMNYVFQCVAISLTNTCSERLI